MIEVAILAPVFLALMSFVVFVGRIGSLEQKMQSAARDGARAASLRTPESAVAAANEAASQTLSYDNVSCENLRVDVDNGQHEPGGSVAVTVSCEVAVTDLSGLPLPGGKTISSRQVSVIDHYATPRS